MAGATGPAILWLFPLDGPEYSADLRSQLSGDFYPLSSGHDGRVLYGVSRTGDSGIKKLEIDGLRESVVPGSAGIQHISSITPSLDGHQLFIIGLTQESGHLICGDFAIDLTSGSVRLLKASAPSGCDSSISPDAKRIVSTINGKAEIVDLESGIRVQMGPGVTHPLWSPDGQMIAATTPEGGKGRVFVVNSGNPTKRRYLASAQGPPVWSPDSRYIALDKGEISCALTLYGWSLQVVDVRTGRRMSVKSSHCRVSTGAIFWVNSDAVRR